MPTNHFAINTRSINNIKQKKAKISTIKTYKRDIRQITLLKKLKCKSSALEKFV